MTKYIIVPVAEAALGVNNGPIGWRLIAVSAALAAWGVIQIVEFFVLRDGKQRRHRRARLDQTESGDRRGGGRRTIEGSIRRHPEIGHRLRGRSGRISTQARGLRGDRGLRSRRAISAPRA